MKFLISDTETVGLNPPASPASGVVEAAYLELDMDTLEIVNEVYSRTNPGCEIHPEASKVHGIYAEDVVDSPQLEDVYYIPDAAVHCGHNCVTGDHEILTKQGWKRFEELSEDVVEAAVWQDGEIRFAKSMVVRKNYAGKMYAWNTEFHRGVYTPEHTMIYTKTRHMLGGGSPVWEKAAAAVYAGFGPNSVAIPTAGMYQAQPTIELSPAEARVLEMVRADGNLDGSSVRVKVSKPRKVQRARELLEAAGVPFSEHPGNSGSVRFSILACALRQKLTSIFKSGKRYGPWVLDIPDSARVAIVDEAAHWDGHVTNRESDNKCQTTVHSVHKPDLEWLQIASVLSNKGSKEFEMTANTRGFSTGRPIGKVTVRARNYVKTLCTPKEVAHSGLVYCLTTPTGAFVIRRNGAVWVTGNCSFDLKFLAARYDNLVGSLCTLALSRQYIHDSPNHKLGTLVEHLGLPKGNAHNALADCHMTRHLLIYLIEKSGRSLQAHIAAARKPKVIMTMPFGKFKGQRIATLPKWYIDFFADKEIDPDLRYSFDQALKMRL